MEVAAFGMAEWEGRSGWQERDAVFGMAGRGRCVRSDRGGVFRWWQAMLAGMMVAMLGSDIGLEVCFCVILP